MKIINNKISNLCLLSICSFVSSLSNVALAENHALLIGINKYQNVSSLVGSDNDVANMKQFAVNSLAYKNSQIKTLIDGEATKKNILENIRSWLIKQTNSGDNVLFYYSGHGSQIPDSNGDEDDKQDEVLVSVDATTSGKNMVTDDELAELFDEIKDRKVTIIVDSCHSGTISRDISDKSLEKYRKKPIKGKSRGMDGLTTKEFEQLRKDKPLLKSTENRTVWTAVTAAQVALVDRFSKKPRGVFTSRFIDGIQNKKADIDNNGVVTNAEALKYIREQSKQYCKKEKTSCKQGLTPQLEIAKQHLADSFTPVSGFTIPVEEQADSILPTQNPIYDDKKTISFDVEVDGRLLTNPAKMQLNDTMFINLVSQQNGYLLLLDRNAKGEISQLFPNASVTNNYIKAKQDIFIPTNSSQYELVAKERGKSQLIAIITHDKVDISYLNKKDIIPVEKPDNYLASIAERLQEPWIEDTVNREADYSIEKFDYTVN